MTTPTARFGRSLVVAAALGIMLAACGGDTEDAQSAGAAESGSVVSTATVDDVKVFVDAEVRSLYTADVEQGGEILCVDACASFWEPVPADEQQAQTASNELGANFGVIQRPDGDRQLTYEGLPLYTFAEEGPGDLTGDGFTDDFQGTHFEWQAAQAEGSADATPAPDDSGGGYGY
jgi:predicted lipoprotein with Yx(FWY)xxD motif